MEYKVNGKGYKLTDRVKENKKIRLSFDSLSQSIFDISFEEWYQNGYWTDQYIPYALLDDEKVVSNISVNIIDTIWKNQKKRYIQLGTVMTDKAYRGQGLSKFLMEQVLAEWINKCDAIYLFANSSVLDFYPKFGFVKANEYQFSRKVETKRKKIKNLDMSVDKDKALLFEKYQKSNPFSALPMIDNKGLLMFYCSQFMKESVYYVEEFDAVVIKEQKGDQLLCYDIFCDKKYKIEDVLSAITDAEINSLVLGFTPKAADNYQVAQLQEVDTTLFVFASKENIFAKNHVMFPLLSHA